MAMEQKLTSTTYMYYNSYNFLLKSKQTLRKINTKKKQNFNEF